MIREGDYIKENPEKVMQVHGKSFFWASQIFSSETMAKVSELYTFCRFVDDTADENTPEVANKELNRLEKDLKGGLTPYMQQVQNLFAQSGINLNLADELIAGARFDVQSGIVRTRSDLLLYCYRVAGVVGLMMCPIIGVSRRDAHAYALDLGIGMQLTNISRDILEDAQNRRLYLPAEELEAASLDLKHLSRKGQTPAALKDLVREYLELADTYYESAAAGYSYIPLRPRLAILVAARLYQAIGHKIRADGYEVLAGRTYLSHFEKIKITLSCVGQLFRVSFWRNKHEHLPSLHQELVGLPGVSVGSG